MVITVNYIPLSNFVYKLQCFQGFLRRKKKNVQRVLVWNLVFYFHIIKNHWNNVWFIARLLLSWYFWIDILFAVCVSQVQVNTLNYALLFTSNIWFFKRTGSRLSACSLIKLLFSNLLSILSVNNLTHMYLRDLRVYFKVEVYFRVT